MRGPQPQKPLGTQCQLPPTLVPDVTNVLSAGALVAMDGVHPSVSLKREPGARGCGCPVLPSAHLGARQYHGGNGRARSVVGRLLGSPGALAGCILSRVDVQGSELPARPGSLAQVAPGVKHGSALLALGLLRKEVRELALQSQPFVLPLGSQTYLPSLSHVIGSGPDGSCLQFSMFPHL